MVPQKQRQATSCAWWHKHVAAGLMLACFCQGGAALADDGIWKVQLTEGQEKLKIQAYTEAEVFFRQAVTDVGHDKASSLDDVAFCQESLANLLQVEDKTDEALPFYKKALRNRQKAHGKDSRQTVSLLISLGKLWQLDGDYRRAIKYFRRAVYITAKTDGMESLSLARCEYLLGGVLVKSGKPELGARMYNDALTVLMQKKNLPSAELLVKVLDSYTDLLRRQASRQMIVKNDFQGELLKDRLDSVQAMQGTPQTQWSKQAPVFKTLVTGRLQADAKQEQEGKPLELPAIEPEQTIADSAALEQMQTQRIIFYERMIATDIDSLGANHPSVARDLYGLACAYLSQNDFSKAKPLLLRALKIYRDTYHGDSEPARALQSLVSLLSEEATLVPNVNESGTDYVAGLVPIPVTAQKFEIAVNLDYLAILCSSLGNFDDANQIFAWALSDTALSCGEQSLLVASCLTDYGKLLRDLGRPGQAELMENDAHVIVRKFLYKQAELVLTK